MVIMGADLVRGTGVIMGRWLETIKKEKTSFTSRSSLVAPPATRVVQAVASD